MVIKFFFFLKKIVGKLNCEPIIMNWIIYRVNCYMPTFHVNVPMQSVWNKSYWSNTDWENETQIVGWGEKIARMENNMIKRTMLRSCHVSPWQPCNTNCNNVNSVVRPSLISWTIMWYNEPKIFSEMLLNAVTYQV